MTHHDATVILVGVLLGLAIAAARVALALELERRRYRRRRREIQDDALRQLDAIIERLRG